MKQLRILVTGAHGNIGKSLLAQLQDVPNVKVLAGVRHPRLVPGESADSAEQVEFDFERPATWPQALAGVSRIFLLRPPALSDMQRTLNPFIDFALKNGKELQAQSSLPKDLVATKIEAIVFLSVAGAEKNSFVPHRKVEDHLAQVDAPFINLRPGFFAQNLQSAYLEDIRRADRIYVPAGKNSEVNWIDTRDIAEVAAKLLCEPEGHLRRSYTLCGPGPVPWSTVTKALSQQLGRTIDYCPASLPGYFMHLRARGLPQGAIIVQSILHFLLRFGQGATVNPTLTQLLGRRPRSIEDYIKDHAYLFAPGKTKS